ncbi:MAG: hypothetical protein H0W81_00600 [Chloroflexi bacterium]|nr:hypothetical protein [Chloroflexota bacterium]
MTGRLGPKTDLVRGTLVAALLAAGGIHLWLTPEHFEESPIVGTGFLAAGILQLLLAVALLYRPSRLALLAVGVSSAGLIAAYGVAVAVGLPFASQAAGGMEEGLRLGAGEPVTLLAIIAKAIELGSIVLAMMLLGRLNSAQGRRATLRGLGLRRNHGREARH